MPLVCSVPDHLDLHPYKGPSKYLESEVMEYTQIFVKKKIPISKKCIFHEKIGNQLKRTWHHMKAETLKKPCVKFEELRENRICQNINLETLTARPDITNLITGFFSSKNHTKNGAHSRNSNIYMYFSLKFM